jgi:hypothetical protein
MKKGKHTQLSEALLRSKSRKRENICSVIGNPDENTAFGIHMFVMNEKKNSRTMDVEQ